MAYKNVLHLLISWEQGIDQNTSDKCQDARYLYRINFWYWNSTRDSIDNQNLHTRKIRENENCYDRGSLTICIACCKAFSDGLDPSYGFYCCNHCLVHHLP